MRHHQGFLRQSQQGRTLVEIMISLTIGLLLLLVITSLFVANKQTYRTSDDKSRLDEEGRLALHLMAFHIRMAGYGTLLSTTEQEVDVKETSGSTPADVSRKVLPKPRVFTNLQASYFSPEHEAIFGCPNGFDDPANANPACKSGTGQDAIAVNYVVDERMGNAVSSTAGMAPTVPVDCLGSAIAPQAAVVPNDYKKISGAGAYYLVENRFFIQNNPRTNNPELYCQGNGGNVVGTTFPNAAQPIAENVEQMRIMYGVSTVDGGQVADRFVSATELNTPTSGVKWSNVVSAQICLVVRSANDGLATSPQSYRDCSNAVITATDRRLRSVFSSTISLRSRAVGAT